VIVSTVFIFATSYAFVKVASTFMAVRATVTEEIQGLDLADHGVTAEVEELPTVPVVTTTPAPAVAPAPAAAPA
jgi:ammonia channel protein AmtB